MLLQIVSHLKYIVNNKREAETFSAFESPDAARSRRASKEAFMPEEATKQSCAAMVGGSPFRQRAGRGRGRRGTFLASVQKGFPRGNGKTKRAAMVGRSSFRQRAGRGRGRRGTLSHRVKGFRQGKRRNKARRHAGWGIALSPTRVCGRRTAGNAIPSGQRVPPEEAAKQSCAAMVRESVFRRCAVAGGGRRGTLLASGQMGFPGETAKQSAPLWLGNPSLAGAQGAAAGGGRRRGRKGQRVLLYKKHRRGTRFFPSSSTMSFSPARSKPRCS